MRRTATFLAGTLASMGFLAIDQAPAAADGTKADVCWESGVSDPAEGTAVDIAAAKVALGCDGAAWFASFATYETWSVGELRTVAAFADVDDDPATGCRGFDYAVAADAEGGTVYRTADCDADWLETGDVQVGRPAGTTMVLGIDAGAIGDPVGPTRWFLGAVAADGSGSDVTSVITVAGPSADDRPGTFDNGRCEIPYSQTATANAVERLYRADFLRPADPEGLGYWVAKHRSGELCLTDVSEYFAGSEEFIGRYGAPDDPGFVRLVYANVLGRDPDPEGHDYWVARLAGGLRRGTLLVGFSESAEFRERTGLA